MALIKDGYWQDTYWASRYWQEDYWSEYGTYVAPTPSVGAATFGQAPKPRFPIYLMKLIGDYLESEVL